MTVGTDLFDTVKALVGNRVYPDLAPTGTVAPYIVYQQVGGEAPTFLERAVPSKKNGRFQITPWTATREATSALAVLIESAMVAATAFQAKPLGAPVALYDEDTKLRGSTQDFTVWSER